MDCRSPTVREGLTGTAGVWLIHITEFPMLDLAIALLPTAYCLLLTALFSLWSRCWWSSVPHSASGPGLISRYGSGSG